MDQAGQKVMDTKPENEEEQGETICYCFDVPDTTIKRVIRENHFGEVDQVTDACNAGGGCTSCHPDIEELIDQIWEEEGWEED